MEDGEVTRHGSQGKEPQAPANNTEQTAGKNDPKTRSGNINGAENCNFMKASGRFHLASTASVRND